MKKRNVLLLGMLLGGLILSSCSLDFNFTFPSTTSSDDPSLDITDDTDPIDDSSSDTSTRPEETDNYYKSEMVDPYFNYQDLLQTGSLNAIPTPRKDLNILVLPIQFTNYIFTDNQINDIKKVFNGTPSETNYWESVASFYQKSSLNQVNINFTVANVYNTGKTARSASKLTATYTDQFSTILLRSAVNNYKQSNSTKQFDQDEDGFIDAVWMIYSCPNYQENSTIESISNNYWAYVYWDYEQGYSTSSPNANVYAWASYDFMYYDGDTAKLDAHTYIHETGHLFGLDDYYNYDKDSNDGPMGKIDMMDHNIIDHNVWSKMALGWIKPYVVTGNATITINPSQLNGDAILLTNNWNGTSFDEFLMLELYTPTGLNELDSSAQYYGSYPRGFTVSGVRMYHVDSRLGLFNYSNKFSKYEHPSGGNLINPNGSFYDVAHSNTPSYTQNKNRLIHMIQAGKTNTYNNGRNGTNADLFKTGNEFTINDYSAFFKSKKLNNGEKLNYKIEFYEVSSKEATIIFTKL